MSALDAYSLEKAHFTTALNIERWIAHFELNRLNDLIGLLSVSLQVITKNNCPTSRRSVQMSGCYYRKTVRDSVKLIRINPTYQWFFKGWFLGKVLEVQKLQPFSRNSQMADITYSRRGTPKLLIHCEFESCSYQVSYIHLRMLKETWKLKKKKKKYPSIHFWASLEFESRLLHGYTIIYDLDLSV